jgi:hypothetical protein
VAQPVRYGWASSDARFPNKRASRISRWAKACSSKGFEDAVDPLASWLRKRTYHAPTSIARAALLGLLHDATCSLTRANGS